MVDTVPKEVRPKMMAAVKGANTHPERRVREKLSNLGYRYRLHVRELPGRPDLVFRKSKIAVFVHGCFWHGHSCPKGRRPKSNKSFWNQKLSRNSRRDRENQEVLKAKGWKVCVIWACSLDSGIKKLLRMLKKRPN